MKSFTLFRLAAVGVVAMTCVASAASAEQGMGGPPPGYFGPDWGPGYGQGPGYGPGPGYGRGMGYGRGLGPCREASGPEANASSAAGNAPRPGTMPGMMQGRGGMARHMLVMREGLPSKYRTHENPVAATQATLTEGERVYAENCASCHDESGFGNGPEGKELNPRPANLYRTLSSRIASDGFLFWTISEGGEALGTGMKAFKGKLTDDQIWKVITFLRAGMPRMAGADSKAAETARP